MVDSGAKRTVINKKLVRGYNSLRIRETIGEWFAANSQSLEVVGVDLLFICAGRQVVSKPNVFIAQEER